MASSAFARCDHCGWLGRTQALGGENVTGLRIGPGFIVDCPRCHRGAAVLPGLWDIGPDDFVLRSGPPETIRSLVEILTSERWDRERLRLLQRTLKAGSSATEPEAVLDEVEQMDPRLREPVSLLGRPETANVTQIIQMLLAVVTIVLMIKTGSGSASPEQIREIVQQVIEHEQETGHGPPTPP